MEIIKIDKTIDNININFSKLNVAAYVRVSTQQEGQTFSLQSQKKYYENLISKNANWNFVKVYSDYGISGKDISKRTEFQQMIEDAMKGKIDLIFSKSISRFSRNTVDSLKYIRLLKSKNIAVIFEEEGINTLNLEGEMILAVFSSVAQKELELISNRSSMGKYMLAKQGKIVFSNNIYGYERRNDKGEFIIKENEAEVIRLIYKLYLEQKSIIAVKRSLEQMNIKTAKGKDIWSVSVIRTILKNEQYIGDILYGKYFTNKNARESEHRLYIKNHHLGIISRSDFERVRRNIK